MLKIQKKWAALAAAVCVSVIAATVYESHADDTGKAPAPANSKANESVTISDIQAKQVKVVPAQMLDFIARREAVGYIDFNQDRSVQVFSPYQGRIQQVLVKAGDDVKKGQALFSIDSPDLITAESTLITTAGLVDLTTKALERAKKMRETQANAQKDVEQATSDQQTAEANYRAARDALRIFGKTDSDIDKLMSTRKVNGELFIFSPINGRVTARNAAPGVLLQPGNAPAPIAVADISSMWMVANVSEADIPLLKVGQKVDVMVDAYAGKTFQAEITNLAASVDPATHHLAVRSEMKDAQHLLRPQMLATFVINTGGSAHAVSVPASSIVREGDGTMSVFVTQDERRFTRRTVQLGMEQNGRVQILQGLTAQEKVAGDGALFLSNALALQAR